MSGAVSTHDCPGGCGEQVSYHRFCCPECWRRLPTSVMRQDIRSTYQNDNEEPREPWCVP